MRTETYKPDKKSIFKPHEKTKKRKVAKSKSKRKSQPSTINQHVQQRPEEDEVGLKEDHDDDITSSEESDTEDEALLAFHAQSARQISIVELVQSPNTFVIRAKELDEIQMKRHDEG